MDMFRYTARNARGEDTAGVVDAASLEEALEQLLDRGLRDVQVTRMRRRDSMDAEPGEEGSLERVRGQRPQCLLRHSRPWRCRPRMRANWPSHVAQVSAAKLPLAAGLRAAAEETANRRVCRWPCGGSPTRWIRAGRSRTH